MDVSDIKSLFAEVKKRMDAQLDHVRRELAGVARAEGLTAEEAFDAVQDAFQTFRNQERQGDHGDKGRD